MTSPALFDIIRYNLETMVVIDTGINRAVAQKWKVSIMALRKQKSNIINLGMTVLNEDEKAGMTIDQTILNGKSAVVSFRLINGGRKSAAAKLDRQAVMDLAEALQEILATDGDF